MTEFPIILTKTENPKDLKPTIQEQLHNLPQRQFSILTLLNQIPQNPDLPNREAPKAPSLKLIASFLNPGSAPEHS